MSEKIDTDVPKSRSKGEVSGQFELKTIRRSFQTTAACLIVDDEEITVGTIDVTQPDVEG